MKPCTRLQALLEPVVTALGYELVGIEQVTGGRRGLVRLYIDQPAGVAVDDCERVSRQVSAVLDVEDPIAGGYVLEVSSPGLDRPLYTPAHYARFAGCRARLKLRTPLLGDQRNVTCTLLGVDEDKVRVEVDGVEHHIPLVQIAKARLIATP
ncbi:MAG TPA: ribosome maturation factor RimP [Gammaproteobacteria bacterium]|nr:ribosome maturation factor RimP [Gammaproteobacteria bacterium]